MSMGTGVGARLRAARARLRDESAAVAGIRPGSGDPAVLSDEQRRVWLVDRISGGSPEYNVPHAVTAGVHFDPVTFRRALVATVDEHDILRTGYADRDGAPTGVLFPADTVPVTVHDLPLPDMATALERAADEADRAFDLTAGPPVRAVLWPLADGRWLVLVTVHHIAVDEVAVGLLWQELSARYRQIGEGRYRPGVARTDRVRLADVTSWERGRAADGSAALEHWAGVLAGLDAHILPTDFDRPRIIDTAGAEERFIVPAEVMASIRHLSAAQNASEFMGLLAGFAAAMSMHAGAVDIAVGTPVVGRDRPELAQVIGSFINVVVVRTMLAGAPGFGEVLRRVRDAAVDAFAHRDVPFMRVTERIAPHRSLARNPLFQTMFTVAEPATAALDVPALDSEPVSLPVRRSKVDLSVVMTVEADGSATGAIHYQTALFTPDTVAQLARTFISVLQRGGAEPERPVAEALRVAEPFSHGPVAAPEPHPLGRRILEQARRSPGDIAVAAGAAVLTYRDLDDRSAAVAAALTVAPGDVVGVCLSRSPDLVVALLAAWRSGAAYVPLDPGFGAERVRYMLGRSAVAVVLVDAATAAMIRDLGLGVRTLQLDDITAAAVDGTGALDAEPGPLAYEIYTSGSTGRPKGVRVTHAGVANFAADMLERVGLTSNDVVGAMTTVSFDIAVLELLVPLAAGARVELLSTAVTTDGAELSAQIGRAGITVLQATPAGWSALITSGWSGAPVRALCGGEALPAELARQLRSRVRRLWNVYGPTETTIWSSAHEIDTVPPGSASVPLGTPLRNTTLHVLDDRLVPLPQGAIGELHIGGVGVAAGYVGDPRATAAAFLPDPGGVPGSRRYRTGDLVRARSDGGLEFRGRNDRQVKIRGYRIEPAEIESRLASHPDVDHAAVAVRGQGLDACLVAYVVWSADGRGTWEDVRAELARFLPDYMVPSRVVEMPTLPTTPNGKIDRDALPAPVALRAGGDGGPRNPLEQRVAAVWSEVLGTPDPPIDADFFGLGGHSLKATQLAARLRAEVAAEVTAQLVFTCPTIREQAAVLAASPAPVTTERAAPPEPTPMSYAQHRLWFMEQLQPGRRDYVVTSAVQLRGRLDPTALRTALRRLTERHAILRTRFRPDPDGTVRPVADLPAPRLQTVRAGDATSAQHLLSDRLLRPFDLADGPLTRMVLVEIGNMEHVLGIAFHHAIVDGWSVRLIWAELSAHYRAARAGATDELAAAATGYADFARWERLSSITVDATTVEADLEYWRALLDGARATEIPATRTRPTEFDRRGDVVHFDLGPAAYGDVKALAAVSSTTPYVVLLAAFVVTVGLFAGERDVSIGMPINGHGRVRPEYADVIGPFVNTVVVRAVLDRSMTFEALLVALHSQMAGALAHQRAPFELVVERLQPKRDPARNPLFQIMFSLDADDHLVVDLPGLAAAPLDVSGHEVKTDLSLSLVQREGRLAGSLAFATALYHRDLVRSLADVYRQVLDALVADPTAAVTGLDLGSLDPDQPPACPRPRTLPELFAAAAAARPNAPALRHRGRTVSYRDLANRVDGAAADLAARGARPGSRIGIVLPRSVDLVVALLATLRCGAVCVPLDRRQPLARLRLLAAEARITLLLARPTDADVGSGVPVLDPTTPPARSTPAPAGPEPRDIAYLTFTSGSTGRPKAVPTTHAAAAEYLELLRADHDLGDRDVVVQMAAISFDASVRDILGPLTSGAEVVLLDDDVVGDPRAVLAEAARTGATALLSVVPSVLALLTRVAGEFSFGCRLVLTSGEVLSADTAAAAMRCWPGVRLVNQYGPTETAMTATRHPVTADDVAAGSVPVGRPLPGSTVHLLDENGRRLPPGAIGMIHVGGSRVSHGYLDQPATTAAAFVPDPFGPSGARMYRTGDLARVDRSGLLSFLGRVDDQMKIRGVRVEPGEVEAALRRMPHVHDVAVVAVAGRLVAYLTAAEEHRLEHTRADAAAQLPTHLRPDRYVVIDALPLNAHNKVDRGALAARPLPDDVVAATSTGPRTSLELELCAVWERVLGRAIGVDDDFFEWGGHSLKAVELVDAVAALVGVPLPLNVVFMHPTVAGMAAAVTDLRRNAPRSLLVPLVQRNGTRPPLVLVHPQSGDVCCYLDVARQIGVERSVYGVEAVGYSDDREPLTDLRDMAAHYVTQLRDVVPHGPYLLAGWSFGGNVAFEMAGQLRAAGERVDFLGLIDARAFGTDGLEEWYGRVPERERFGRAHGIDTAELEASERTEAVLELLTRKLTAEGKLPEYSDTNTIRRMVAVFDANGRAADTYRTGSPIDVDLHLLRATERHPTLTNPAVRPESWRGHTVGRLHTVDLPGNHHDLFSADHAATTAAALAAAIDPAADPADPAAREQGGRR
ncbi:amino acid adenylation domain-containing protein [Pseudonocardia alni]|uniref:Amino acid adenylation domain-containing protein n=1 Tax=Pseudonocardia alni TaxID=33907 RepID=A0A852W9V8_PSEA5|nr:non-ribosomal peptide synthetase [Pseudonocardia antarctica]NYG05400.1 amino acid adenylation domain-containing protein [Pseudonocardia antarctica]